MRRKKFFVPTKQETLSWDLKLFESAKKPQFKNKNKVIPTHLSATKKIKLILAFLAVDLIFNWTVEMKDTICPFFRIH